MYEISLLVTTVAFAATFLSYRGWFARKNLHSIGKPTPNAEKSIFEIALVSAYVLAMVILVLIILLV